jgi:hypothetical protein
MNKRDKMRAVAEIFAENAARFSDLRMLVNQLPNVRQDILKEAEAGFDPMTSDGLALLESLEVYAARIQARLEGIDRESN